MSVKPWEQFDEDILTLTEEELGKKLVVHNDDINTFEWVIQSLMEICNHQFVQAEQCAYIVHFKGKCSVKEGELDRLRPMKEGLTDRGIQATIE